jgi:hypothetical protein
MHGKFVENNFKIFLFFGLALRDSLMRLGRPADGFIGLIISSRYYRMGFIFLQSLTFLNFNK